MQQTIADFFEKFGFRRSLGQIWATIYFSPEAVSQNELRERLDMSVGLVSSSLKELEHWGMIRQVSVAGTRRTYYRAEDHLLRVVTSILSKRELPMIEGLREAVIKARWESSGRGADVALDDRLRAIEEAAELYTAMADLVVIIAKLPAGVLKAATEGIRAFRDWDPWEPAAGPVPFEPRGDSNE